MSAAETYTEVNFDQAADYIKGRVSILDAYTRWGGVSPVKAGRREQLVRCPMPEHEDKNPSCSLNADKGMWKCYSLSCDRGGDIYDLAAAVKGFDPKNDFVPIMAAVMSDFGIQPEDLPAPQGARPKVVALKPVEDDDEPEPEPETEGTKALSFEPLDWRWIMAQPCMDGTFLKSWMERNTGGLTPDTYVLWLGLQLVGMAAGDTVWLNSPGGKIKTRAHLMLLGDTGTGKSVGTRMPIEVAKEAFPWDEDLPTTNMVRIAPKPQSGEALLDLFEPTIINGRITGTRGYLSVDEAQELMTTASRAASTLREVIMALIDGSNANLYSIGRGNRTAEGAFMSLITGAQPEALSSIFSKNDASSGFLNRLIIINGQRQTRPRWGEAKSFNASDFTIGIQSISAWATAHQTKMGNGAIDIDPEPEVFEEWDHLLDELEAHLDTQGAAVKARLGEHAMKTALLLAVNCRHTLIGPELIEITRHLMRSLIEGYEIVAGTVGINEMDRLKKRVLEILVNSETPLTRSGILRQMSKQQRDPVRVGQALVDLERFRLIKQATVINQEPGRELWKATE